MCPPASWFIPAPPAQMPKFTQGTSRETMTAVSATDSSKTGIYAANPTPGRCPNLVAAAMAAKASASCGWPRPQTLGHGERGQVPRRIGVDLLLGPLAAVHWRGRTLRDRHRSMSPNRRSRPGRRSLVCRDGMQCPARVMHDGSCRSSRPCLSFRTGWPRRHPAGNGIVSVMALHRGSSPIESTAGTSNPLITEANPALGERLTPPKSRLAQDPVPADVAYQLIHDELLLDGSARLNLATFVTTWMEPQARQLMADCVDKNMIDKDEYPQTAELERRCVAILADLWHAPSPDQATGCSTTGSSEACMLAGLALQRRWAARVNDRTRRPNLVMGANVQVCWEKFCRYWDVEARIVPMSGERFHLDAEQAVARCDVDTIGVVTIQGSTMDGSYEPVAEISAELDRLAATGGPDVPIHVDAASGGFVAPFIQPDLVWDFQLPRVASINASGHKYGLVYPGVGWVVWRSPDALPDDLVFRVNYLGGEMPTFALNFSRSGANVAAQYYNFLRLGFDGYQRVQQACQDVSRHLSSKIARMEPFELLSDGSDLPVFAFRIRDESAGFTVFDLSERLRTRGWILPAYTFPANLEHVAVLRVVVRNGFSKDLADSLLSDLQRHVRALAAHPRSHVPLAPADKRESFAH